MLYVARAQARNVFPMPPPLAPWRPKRKAPLSVRPMQVVAIVTFMAGKVMGVMAAVAVMAIGQQALPFLVLYVSLIAASAAVAWQDHVRQRNAPDRWDFLGANAWRPD